MRVEPDLGNPTMKMGDVPGDLPGAPTPCRAVKNSRVHTEACRRALRSSGSGR